MPSSPYSSGNIEHKGRFIWCPHAPFMHHDIEYNEKYILIDIFTAFADIKNVESITVNIYAIIVKLNYLILYLFCSLVLLRYYHIFGMPRFVYLYFSKLISLKMNSLFKKIHFFWMLLWLKGHKEFTWSLLSSFFLPCLSSFSPLPCLSSIFRQSVPPC